MTEAPDAWKIYSGPLRLESGGHAYDGFGKVAFVFRPTPSVRVGFGLPKGAGDAAVLGAWWDISDDDWSVVLPDAVVLEDPQLQEIDAEFELDGDFASRTFFRPRRFGIGDGTQITELSYGVVNFDAVPLPDDNGSLQRSWTVDEWYITLVDASAGGIVDRLNATGGFGRTHSLVVRRVDAAPFDAGDVGPLHEGLFLILSFMKGSLVGLALPTGRNSAGEVVYIDAGTTVVSSWSTHQTWFDHSEIGVLGDLLGAWLQRSTDDFWRRVLARAIRISITANHADPLDVAIPAGFTALELLAWAVLVSEQDWVRPSDGELNAQAMIRLLLRWAEIPTELPDELKQLRDYAGGAKDLDGPTAIAFTRNRLVHPPKKGSLAFPPWPAMIDAYRLEMEYTELLILRLLNHNGVYGHRRHLGGRWIGDTEPVPWAKPRQ